MTGAVGGTDDSLLVNSLTRMLQDLLGFDGGEHDGLPRRMSEGTLSALALAVRESLIEGVPAAIEEFGEVRRTAEGWRFEPAGTLQRIAGERLSPAPPGAEAARTVLFHLREGLRLTASVPVAAVSQEEALRALGRETAAGGGDERPVIGHLEETVAALHEAEYRLRGEPGPREIEERRAELARLEARKAAASAAMDGRRHELQRLGDTVREAKERREALQEAVRAAESKVEVARQEARAAEEAHRKASNVLDELLARLSRVRDTLA